LSKDANIESDTVFAVCFPWLNPLAHREDDSARWSDVRGNVFEYAESGILEETG